MDRDTAMEHSPYIIGDSVMRIIAQNRGRNYRAAIFTHDCWLMLMNFPSECWDLNTIVKSLAQYSNVLIWNRDNSNRARILVKIRVYDIDKIPMSIVVTQTTSDEGTGGSWSCPTIIISATMLGAVAGDEDPLPPDGANPHPLPIVVDDFAMWHADHEGIINHNNNVAPPPDNVAPAQGHAAPAAAEEPNLDTPPQSPNQHVPG